MKNNRKRYRYAGLIALLLTVAGTTVNNLISGSNWIKETKERNISVAQLVESSFNEYAARNNNTNSSSNASLRGITNTTNNPNNGGATAATTFTSRTEETAESFDFEIIVLTMDRADALHRLLDSLEDSDYGDDRVRLTIQIDHSEKNAAVIELANTFAYTHGPKVVQVAQTNKGLRAAWLEGWDPPLDGKQHAIIFEDDLEVSPVWYQYVKKAWETYHDAKDIAGISLNRQTLIAEKAVSDFQIVNNHEPFLYKLVGSQGFSPHPDVWRQFLEFCRSVDLNTFRAVVPGLITTEWYSKLPKRGMWTQLFIYFCEQHNLYNLYVNLPDNKALVSHLREKGEHFDKSLGADFAVAKTLSLENLFPASPVKYSWDGKIVNETNNDVATAQSPPTTAQAVPPKFETVGSENGGWTYDPSVLRADSLVYSVGLGEDTSWEEGIMEKHKIRVFGYDPTPKSIKYVQSRKQLNSSLFHFEPQGLSTYNHRVNITVPVEGGLSLSDKVVGVWVNTLENWMKVNGHMRLAILKMDIGGSEYDVIEDWLKTDFLPMDQLLVKWLEDKSRHDRIIEGLAKKGWNVAHSQNGGQKQMFLRSAPDDWLDAVNKLDELEKLFFDKDFTDSESKKKLLESTISMMKEHEVVAIQLLNEGYVEMTTSWICNVKNFPGVLDRTLFIATDKAAYDALTKFNVTLNVVHVDYQAPKNLSYGQYAYYSFMLFRTRLICFLLAKDVTLWLIESDAVWIQDPTDEVLSTEGDMVTMSDGKPPMLVLQGGFQLLRPTTATLTVWTKLLKQFADTLKKSRPGTDLADAGSEQLMMNKLIRGEPKLHFSWLEPRHYFPGLYYRDPGYRATAKEPRVILNNYIIGNDAKIARAKKWGHWFVKEDGTCDEDAAKMLAAK